MSISNLSLNEKKIVLMLTQFEGGLKQLTKYSEMKVVPRDKFRHVIHKVIIVLLQLKRERMFSSEWIDHIEGDLHRIKNHLRLS